MQARLLRFSMAERSQLECGGTKLRRNYKRRGSDTSAHAHNGTAARTAHSPTECGGYAKRQGSR